MLRKELFTWPPRASALHRFRVKEDLLAAEFDFVQRPLRLVTGCSGAEAPHFAMRQLVGHEGFEQLFGSEINENPRRFILRNCNTKHLFEDVCYVMQGSGACARHGGRCSVPGGEVDIFVGGFPCTPYSFCNPKRFKRNCFTEPAAVPFFEMRKFIAERRPRLVILENVKGLLAPNPETEHPPIDFILRGRNPGKDAADKEMVMLPETVNARKQLVKQGVLKVVVEVVVGRKETGEDEVKCVEDEFKAGKQDETLRPSAHEQAVGKNDHTWDNFDGYQNGSASTMRQTRSEQENDMYDIYHGIYILTCLKMLVLTIKNELESQEDCYQGTEPNADWGLSLIEGYGLRWDILYSYDWGLPQSRPRVYIVMVREDAGGQKAAERIFDVLTACAGRLPRGSCNDFLFPEGHPKLELAKSRVGRCGGGPRKACTKFTEALFRTKRQELGIAASDRPYSKDRAAGWFPQATARLAAFGPVIGAVLFAGLVSLDWGEGRHAVSRASLPSPLEQRPDIRKIVENSVVLAKVTPSLVDDDNEEAVDALQASEAASSTETGELALSRRAAVLLAMAKELSHEPAKREKMDKASSEPKKAGLLAAIQAVAVESTNEEDQEMEGDGTGWSERYSRIESQKAPDRQLCRWLQEAAHLLASMEREERSDSAKHLQLFVVKSLQVFSDARDSDLTNLAGEGLSEAVEQLWSKLRFSEAKALRGRLLTANLLSKLSTTSLDGFDSETWLNKAASLEGVELSSQRARLLQGLSSSRRRSARLLASLLRRWNHESVGDQELLWTQKAVESLQKAWTSTDCPEAWVSFASVGRMSKSCLEIAKKCENQNRPKSSQSFREIAHKLQTEVFAWRLGHALASATPKDFSQYDALHLESEQMTSEEAGFVILRQSAAWKLLQHLKLQGPKSGDLDFTIASQESIEEFARVMTALRAVRESEELSHAADGFLRRCLPSVAAMVHATESVGQAMPDPVRLERFHASEQNLHDCLKTRLSSHLQMKLGNWSLPSLPQRQWEQELQTRISESSNQLNILMRVRMYKRYRRCAAMGGGDGESAPLQIPGAVSDGCPAFADGCPYSKNDEMLEWIKEKRSDAIGACPAFKEGCPFTDASDITKLQAQLAALPPSHAGEALGEKKNTAVLYNLGPVFRLLERRETLQTAMALTVEVARLDGSVVQKLVPPEETVLGLKRLLASDAGLSTAQFRLLLDDRALRNELCLSAVATDDILSLQFVSVPVQRAGSTISFVASFDRDSCSGWTVAAQGVIQELRTAGVEQGQVLWIDFHSSGAEAKACAYFCTELPSRGDLEVAFEVKSGFDMQELHRWACSQASGREIISITMSSSCMRGRPVTIAIFYYAGELSQVGDVRWISVGGGAWEFAASQLAVALRAAGVQREQLLAVDAHNEHPDDNAMFCAYYTAARQGSGPVALDWRAFNRQCDWQVHYLNGSSVVKDEEVTSITASSNCAGRTVQYAFWQAAGDLPEHFHVEMANDAWEEAAKELLRKLVDAGVQQGQVLSIDAHNKGWNSAAVLLAVVRRSRPGRGPLELSCQVRRDGGWELLYRWADQAAVGKQVVSVTGCSSGPGSCGLALLLFLAEPRPEMSAVDHVASAAGSWNGAADELLQLLQNRGMQQGQLLSIDAHNTEPDSHARFSAHFSSSLPGCGPLRLTYRCSNTLGEWPDVHWQGIVRAASKTTVATTGSSNVRVLFNSETSAKAFLPIEIQVAFQSYEAAPCVVQVQATTAEVTVGGKPHEALMDMLKTVHKASQSMKQTVGADCPVFQEACPFKNCITSSGTPLAMELEWRSWGLWIGDEQAQLAEVQDEGLACKLKEGTKEAHQAAETVHFVKEFVRGRVSRQIYAQFVVNLYHIYGALEEALEANAEHPLIESLHFPEELERTAALKQDAAFFLGENWQNETLPSKTTREYVNRIKQVQKESPELLIPHAYTRYLGDLSGGQVLKKAAIRGMKLPDDDSGDLDAHAAAPSTSPYRPGILIRPILQVETCESSKRDHLA
ncbi:Hmox2 [Symbiodinium sp. KB8]|nr:Hmox2 [Symbiodinium sp. KB8]